MGIGYLKSAFISGNFDGIGIQFNVPNDTAIVLSVIPGGPSEKAGLLQGDRIIQVNEKVIAGTKTPQDSMVRLMKGPSGTKVDIHVQRGKEKIVFDITDVSEGGELAAFCEANNTGLIIGIIAVFVVIAVVGVIIAKKKQQ